MPSRVDPFGDLIVTPARGLMMGNRGGRLHDAGSELGARRWASKQWICCVLDFKGRQRRVWGDSYTELFFLDEVTALAAGHRPCFECRRQAARDFAARFPRVHRAPEIDEVLHSERLEGRVKRTHRAQIDTLPDGVMIAKAGAALALRGRYLLPWTAKGYDGALSRPGNETVEVLTPRSSVAVLAKGYAPLWHPSAAR